MMVLTGAAGFIGSCLLARLNDSGREDILIVDHLDGEKDKIALKRGNLKNKRYQKYLDKKEFLQLVRGDRLNDIDMVIHLGACSSTTLQDARYFQENNFEYSCDLATWAHARGIRFIYASSAATYGNGSCGYSDDHRKISRCRPLNLYGQSKQRFDEWVLQKGFLDEMVGLKFFNVFGPNEYHKGDMRSVIAKSYLKIRDEGKMFLFRSYRKEYADGEQKRDFIYVKDAVEVVWFFIEHPLIAGIFNVGTGKARSWNDLAHSIFRAMGKESCIEYIDMPEEIKERYQYFTQAQIAKLRQKGYQKPFMELEDAVADYLKYLNDEKHI